MTVFIVLPQLVIPMGIYYFILTEDIFGIKTINKWKAVMLIFGEVLNLQ